MTDILSYGSVFSGVGGLDLAVEELTGAKAAWHCESDPHASKVLAAHWPDVPNLGDITQVDWASVTRVDIIAGGFPCQDISNAGKRAGIKEGNRSGLWFSYADAIGVLRPRLVVVENVRALLRNGLDVVLGSLSDLGYDARWTCLRASDVGAPHQRERVFLVAWPRGNREGLGWLRGQPALLAEAGPNLLPTPRARDHKGPGFGDDLPAVARLLPTPSASNFNDGEDLQAWQERRAATKERVGNGNGFGTPLSIAVRLDWGEYDPAVRRWAGVVGRPAPRPTCDEAGQRLNPVLSEWMMGWPEGWVTDVVERRHALKQCGNGVVTRQAIAALSSLADPPLVEETPDILSTHRHVVMMSSGAGSWAAAKRVVAKYGHDAVTLLFADVKGNNPSPHAGEDQDNYRFLAEAAANVGAELVRLTGERDIWQVFEGQGMLGNNRAPICSMSLKQEPTRSWVEANCDPDATTLYLGLDWTEEHRLEPNRRGWAPWRVEYPLMDEPWIDKAQTLDWLRSEGIEPPRLYEHGFSHANCGGFCVQMGQADAARLLRVFPERYRYHEEREEAFRAERGKDVAFMVDRRRSAILAKFGLTQEDIEKQDKVWVVKATGKRLPGRIPLPLRELRLRIEGDPDSFDAEDTGACGCFPFAEVTTPPETSVALPSGPDILSTHQWRGNAQMFAEAVRPLYIRDEDAVLDVTYGLGVFWNDWRPPNLTAHDREPSKAPNGPMDFTALAYTDASFDVVVFDPPYKCVSLDTQALTPTGWASYDEIEVGTEVYTLNHETGLGEWQAVRDVRVVPDPSSPLVEIKGKSHSSLTTSDHRWPVVSLGGRRSWRTTDSFLARDRIPLTARSGCQPALPTIPDAMVELVAWYWTEGHVKGMATGDVTHPGGYGDISQSQVANPTHCASIEAAFRSLYGPPVDRFPRLGRTGSPIPMWRVDRDHRVTKYRFTALVGRQLAQHAPGKIVTSEFLRSLTESQLDLFIDTSMNADGCRSGSMARLTQKREPMAAMFQVACTLAGIGTTTSHHPHLGHMVYLRRRKAIRPLRQATLREVAPQAVWCLSVPNQSWFARREGTTYFTGNCNGTPTDDGRYGVDERASILGRHGLMLDGFREATRVTKVGGYVMVKCMAQVAGGTLHPQDALLWMESLDMDLKLKARYTLVTNPRPQPKVNPDGSPRPQVSPRNNQSTLLVFQKVRRRRS